MRLSINSGSRSEMQALGIHSWKLCILAHQYEAERVSALPGVTMDQRGGSTLTVKRHRITTSPRRRP